MNEKLKSTAVLLLLVLISAAALTGVNALIRLASLRSGERLSLEELTDPFTAVTDGDKFVKIKEGRTDFLKIFKENRHVGYIIESAGEGYREEPISIIVGVDKELVITGVKILSHSETPSVGGRVFSEDILDLFKGQTADDIKLDAVSGATRTSRGLLSAVKGALMALSEALEPK